MSRATYVWDRVELDLVTRAEYDRRLELRAKAMPRHEIKRARRVKRGRWIYRDGKLIDIAHLERRTSGRAVNLIRDIDPYKAAAGDVAAGGAAPVIGGRRQHREFLKRNGYVEHGNEMPTRRAEEMPSPAADLQRALQTGMTPEVRQAFERAKHAMKG